MLCVAPDYDDAAQVARLLQGQYWTEGFSLACMAAAQRGSQAWVVARDGAGEVLASARALSDGARIGWIADVVVRPELRGQGFGTAVMRLLLAHPALRDVAMIRLATRDAEAFYAQLGFQFAPASHSMMTRVR
jgi:GNAT superfamily N-acetyltransferase